MTLVAFHPTWKPTSTPITTRNQSQSPCFDDHRHHPNKNGSIILCCRFVIYFWIIFNRFQRITCFQTIPIVTRFFPSTNTFLQHEPKRKRVIFLQSIYDNANPPENTDKENESNWKVGNYQKDLYNLEMAFHQMQADEDFMSFQRLQVLDEFAKQRRDILQDIKTFLLLPFSSSFLLFIFIVSSYHPSSLISSMSTIYWNPRKVTCHLIFPILVEIILLGMNLSFWMLNIVSPLLLLYWKKKYDTEKLMRKKFSSLQKNKDQEKTERGIQEDTLYSSWFLSSSSSPTLSLLYNKSSTDSITYLLENWISSISGIFIIPLFSFISSFLCYFWSNRIHVNRTIQTISTSTSTMTTPLPYAFPILSMLILQFIVRLGTFASLHQYPVILYQLKCDKRNRPLTFLQTKLQQYVDRVIRIFPWAISFDFLQLSLFIHEFMKNRTNQLYSLWTMSTTNQFVSLYSVALSTSPFLNMIQYPFSFMLQSFLRITSSAKEFISVYSFLPWWCIRIGILLPSIVHMIAFLRLVTVQYFTNLSLASSCNEWITKLKKLQVDEDEIDDTVTLRSTATTTTTTNMIRKQNENKLKNLLQMRWRYKLRWREPKRLAESISSLWRSFLIYMFTGWGGDNEAFASVRVTPQNYADAVLNDDDSKQSLPKILSLIDDDMSKYPDSTVTNRDLWVPKAMERMSVIHQDNYETKNFEDPLGIALQQTLGIGLSFDFDHETPLQNDDNPSIHRLRSRAAKSAIKRFNQLPKEIKSEVDKISDSDEKVRVGLFLTERARQEVRKMVQSLLQFIPTNAPPPEGEEVLLETLKKSDAISLPLPLDIPDPKSWVYGPQYWNTTDLTTDDNSSSLTNDPIEVDKNFISTSYSDTSEMDMNTKQADAELQKDYLSDWENLKKNDTADDVYLA